MGVLLVLPIWLSKLLKLSFDKLKTINWKHGELREQSKCGGSNRHRINFMFLDKRKWREWITSRSKIYEMPKKIFQVGKNNIRENHISSGISEETQNNVNIWVKITNIFS